MSVAYAPRGLAGLLTPQANTTVEPEMAILTPPGHAFLNGRLMSGKPTIPERLKDYFDHYGDAVAQFANAPVDAIGFACTGASYLAGVEAEDALLERLREKTGVPVMTAATAVVDALSALGVDRIALLSPYDEALDAVSAAYWSARGFTVVERLSAYQASDAFHPIYSMAGDGAERQLERIAQTDADAIVMLGTGMPTLELIARHSGAIDAALMSCMSCLGWRRYEAVGGNVPSSASVTDFLKDPGWRQRLNAWLDQSTN